MGWMKDIVPINHVLLNSNVIIHPYVYQSEAFVMTYPTVLFLMMRVIVFYRDASSTVTITFNFSLPKTKELRNSHTYTAGYFRPYLDNKPAFHKLSLIQHFSSDEPHCPKTRALCNFDWGILMFMSASSLLHDSQIIFSSTTF